MKRHVVGVFFAVDRTCFLIGAPCVSLKRAKAKWEVTKAPLLGREALRFKGLGFRV